MSEKDLYQVPKVDVPWMSKKMLQWETCVKEERWRSLLVKKKKEKGYSQGKDPRTLMRTAKVDFSTPKANSQGKDPGTFKEPVEKWRVQKKRREKQWKKKKKKDLVEKVQRESRMPPYGEEERRKERQEE